ncbi:MAG: radical SAM protein [Clostridiales bacterium]|nr:radical SAM protein [Clostridiales bacterium]
MENFKHIFGPVPSRRLGLSLGISPIPEGYCNYSCIYCQLGRTDNMTNTRQYFYKVSEIIDEFKIWLDTGKKVDVITIVGEGEPTLFRNLGQLIREIKKLTKIPVAVITNGGLLYEEEVREDLSYADIVLPSFDASNKEDFVKINRPYGKLDCFKVLNGLKIFSEVYQGQLWIETMLIKDYNDSDEKLFSLKRILDEIKYDRLFINTPVRPPAEKYVEEPTNKAIERAVEILGGTAINHLASNGFSSDIKDDYEAIKSIIKRHPMNQYEIKSFLESRDCEEIAKIQDRLKNDEEVTSIQYKGYITYRI